MRTATAWPLHCCVTLSQWPPASVLTNTAPPLSTATVAFDPVAIELAGNPLGSSAELAEKTLVGVLLAPTASPAIVLALAANAGAAAVSTVPCIPSCSRAPLSSALVPARSSVCVARAASLGRAVAANCRPHDSIYYAGAPATWPRAAWETAPPAPGSFSFPVFPPRPPSQQPGRSSQRRLCRPRSHRVILWPYQRRNLLRCFRHLLVHCRASQVNMECQRHDRRQYCRRGPYQPPVPEPGSPSSLGPLRRSGGQLLFLCRCLLRKKNHLPAPAAHPQDAPQSARAPARRAPAPQRRSGSPRRDENRVGCLHSCMQPSLGTRPIENIAAVFSNSDPDRADRLPAPLRQPACSGPHLCRFFITCFRISSHTRFSFRLTVASCTRSTRAISSSVRPSR